MREELLTALLRYSLFGGAIPQQLPQNQVDWMALYDASRRQAVTALVGDALLLLPAEVRPPRDVLFRFALLTQTVEDDNALRENALAHFAALLGDELGLDACVVKGSSLSRRYARPEHRECGDNDLYTGVATERVAAFMVSRGVPVDDSDPRHSTFEFEGAEFECHNYLLYNNDDIQWEFVDVAAEGGASVGMTTENEASVGMMAAGDGTSVGMMAAGDGMSVDATTEDGASVDVAAGDGTSENKKTETRTTGNGKSLYKSLVPAQEAFFVAKHIEHRSVFFNEPVRLRNLLDWSMLLTSPDFDFQGLAALAKGTDVEVFVDLMTAYCIDCFGLAVDIDGLDLNGLSLNDFYRIYMCCPERHRLAAVRVARRSGKYLRYWRAYKRLYGQSMFKRFYISNVLNAIKQHL